MAGASVRSSREAAAWWLARVAILKTHKKGGVAKNGDVDAMTRLLGGEVPTEEGEVRPQESV